MTIEEKVQQNPEEFKALLDTKTETIQAALRALSQSFDLYLVEILGAIKSLRFSFGNGESRIMLGSSLLPPKTSL